MKKIKIGGKYLVKNNFVVRVILLDKRELFFLEEVPAHIKINYRSGIKTFSHSDLKFFSKNSKWIEDAPLSNEEIDLFVPKIQLRLNCFKDVFWQSETFLNNTKPLDYLKFNGININLLEGIELSEIYIFPLGQSAGRRPPMKIEAKNKKHITSEELVNACFYAQSKHLNAKKNYFSIFRLVTGGRKEKRFSGIGLYRYGLYRGIPSYLLGGSVSLGEVYSSPDFISKEK